MKSITTRVLLLAMAAATAGFEPRANATLLTDFMQLTGTTATVDLSPYAGAGKIQTTGPLNLGGSLGFLVEFNSTNSDLSTLGSDDYGLGVNGRWGGLPYVALDFDLFGGDGYSMTFRFGKAFRAAAARVNYAVPDLDDVLAGVVYGDVLMEALADDGSVLESYNLTQDAPVLTPNEVNGGSWRGVVRNSTDLYGLRFSNAGVVLRDLTLASPGPAVQPIPEPSTFSLMAAALGLSILLGLTQVVHRAEYSGPPRP